MKYFLPLIFCVLSTINAFSQTTIEYASISGKVLDETSNEALFGAKVVVQGLSKGVLVDADGNYSLTGLTSGKYTLEVRNAGYNNMLLTDIIVKSEEKRTLDIKMQKI